MDLSKVTLLGVVGADPRTSERDGRQTAVLRLAINRGERDRKTGALLKATDWYSVVTVGKLAEVVAQYVRKGDRLYVEGRLRVAPPKSGDGEARVEVSADNLIMLGTAKARAGDHGEG